MGWFNYIGMIIFILIMIPNIIYSMKHKDAFLNKNINKTTIILEQIGRYGCITFLIFNIPMTYFDYWFDYAKIVYIIINAVFIIIYLLSWVIPWKSKIVRAALLSITPSFIFLFSGIMILSIPLILFSLLFSISHIYISLRNAKTED